MKQMVVVLAKVVLVCGFGLAGLAAGSTHAATDTGNGHGIFCNVTGECS